ncbi:DUF1194 domain-containing protein [Mesorhizobium sp. M1B.F.Ca.ET.045.04.1.1]|uniref:DUF1194 domain-containing protein n=1 Tax=Mesorhizobium sp. M1B.F.Ca.ET.045.04.1.1 TaxID=2493673 RepID=UPI001675907E
MVGYLHDELNSRSDSTSWHARLRGSLPTPMDRAAGGPGKRSSPWLGLAVISAAALCDPPAHAADTDTAMANVDVAIAFAVDFSASIDPTTADLQREGHAAARSPRPRSSAPSPRIALAASA